MKKFAITLVITGLFIATGMPLWAQAEETEALPDNVPALLVKANTAFADKDYLLFRRILERLHEKRPYNSDYMYQLVNAHALLDEKPAAYDLMLRMQRQGLAYDFTQSDSSMNIRGTEVFDYVNDLMKSAGEPVGESELVVTLPQQVSTPEALAWDESRQKFLVGTVDQGNVYAVGKDGQATRLITSSEENGLWSIFGLLVDPARNRLWVSSAAIPRFARYSPTDKGRSALFEFDLKTLELLRRRPVPVDGRPHILGSMVLDPAGNIFIADRVLPFIFSKPSGNDKLIPVLASREMLSLRGIAMQPDGKIMYVADRELGILVIDVASGKSGKLAVPDNLNVGGIDGLYLWDNHLVIIQNGIKPQRVMRLQLDASGTKVTGVRPLAVAQKNFDYPSFGTVLGSDLVYFGNSHWVGEDATREPIRIVRTPLEGSADLVRPDVQKFLQDQAKKDKN